MKINFIVVFQQRKSVLILPRTFQLDVTSYKTNSILLEGPCKRVKRIETTKKERKARTYQTLVIFKFIVF